MGIICTELTEKFVEPHLGRYEGGAKIEEGADLDEAERKRLRSAGIALLGFVAVFALLTVTPGAPLRSPGTGGIMSGSPFMSGLIVIISLLFFTVGYAYGRGSGTVGSLTDAIGMITKTFSGLAGLILLLLTISQFVAFFNYTNMATVLAANLAEFLETVPINAVGYIILFVLVVFVIDLVITWGVAKWAIFAPVFIPLFMRLGGEPDLVLAGARRPFPARSCHPGRPRGAPKRGAANR